MSCAQHFVPTIPPPTGSSAPGVCFMSGDEASRSTQCLEAHVVLSGRCTFRVAGELLVVGPDSLVWIAPNTKYAVSQTSSDFRAQVIAWPEQTARRREPHLLKCAIRGELMPGLVTTKLSPAVTRALTLLLADLGSQPDPDSVATSLGFEYALCRLAKETQAPGNSSASLRPPRLHRAVRLAIALMRERTTEVSLADVVKQVGCSYSHLARLFRQQVGVTLVDFFNRMRIERFLQRYTESGNLLQASLESGFGSYAQFYRVFRSHFGEGPREYFRKNAASSRQTPTATDLYLSA